MDTRRTMASLEDEEESVRIAVKALGDMRNGTLRADGNRWPQASTSSENSLSNPSSPPPQSQNSPSETAPASPALFTRMAGIPLVKSALTAYEQGKASSRVVKYGAQMVESSVKTLSRPVIERLPVNVNQLDEFACRQLDRFDRYRRPSNGEASSRPTLESISTSETDSLASPRNVSTLDDSDSQSNRSAGTGRSSRASDFRSRRAWKEGGERGVPSWIECEYPARSFPSPSAERSSTPTQASDDVRANRLIAIDTEATPTEETTNDQQVVQRSRWQAMLLEAGGLSAALSEESMRRLKYCLQWLQYATAHIDAQILILRELTASLQTNPPDAPAHARRPNPISEEHMRKLAEVRKDVVQTVRQVVSVVSKYAGGALPEPARTTVRGFILKLPQRWATKAAVVGGAPGGHERDSVTAAASGVAGRRNGTRRSNVARERGTGAEPRSGASSTVVSPSASPRLSRSTLAPLTPLHMQPNHSRVGLDGAADERAGSAPSAGQSVSHGAAIVATQRLLSLATESLDMMRGVTGVVKDSLDKADLWVSRLRSVGLHRAHQESEGDPDAIPTENGDAYSHHRRNSSSQHARHHAPSPFFNSSQSGSSTTWNSSIPSTPLGSGMYTPPGVIQLARMTLQSRGNTPKSVVAELPEEEEGMAQDDGAERESRNQKSAVAGEVRIAGVDDRPAGMRMEVDEP
ncbi:Opi1-domain-containing protein [Coprinellus micaceus]|uniref:Opi1-domain-containing protein n=1 Tax=Coprinellus micaceus TaxID=71717 RepID=A0A4Y7TRP6_COPMI|nr:Opi1-domain-containing protein [Coprinellus micaceus]